MHIKRQIIFFGIILFLSLLFINSEDVFSQLSCPLGRPTSECLCGDFRISPGTLHYCCEDVEGFVGVPYPTLNPSDECRAATTTTTPPATTTPTTPPATPTVITSIMVTSPSSDQQVQVGRELEIRWEADGESLRTDVLLFRRIGGEGGADTSMIPLNTVVVRSHAGTNTFIWNVPSEGLAIGVEEYKIVVLDQINGIRGESGFFSIVREISGRVAEVEVCAPLNVNGILCPLSNLGIPVESCSNIAGNLFRYENCGNRNVEITYSFTAGFEGCEARNFRINKWDGTRWAPIAREQQITINAEQGTATLRTPFDGNGVYAVLAEVNNGCRREFACPESNVIVSGIENNRIREGERLQLLACNLLETPLSAIFTGLTPVNGATISNTEEITIGVAANRAVESATIYVQYIFEGRGTTISAPLPRKAGSPTVFSYTFPAGTILPLEYTYEVVVQDSNGNRASTRSTVGMRTTRVIAPELAPELAPTTPLGFTFNQISLHSITSNVYRFLLTLENGQEIRFRGQANQEGTGERVCVGHTNAVSGDIWPCSESICGPYNSNTYLTHPNYGGDGEEVQTFTCGETGRGHRAQGWAGSSDQSASFYGCMCESDFPTPNTCTYEENGNRITFSNCPYSGTPSNQYSWVCCSTAITQTNQGGIVVAGVLSYIIQVTQGRVIEDGVGSVVEIRYHNVPIEDLANSQFVRDIIENPTNSFNLELFVDGRPARFVSAEVLPEEPNRPATARFTLRIQGVDRLVEDIILVTDSQPRDYLAPIEGAPTLGIAPTLEANIQEEQVNTITLRGVSPVWVAGVGAGDPSGYGEIMFTAVYRISFTENGYLWPDSFSFNARRRGSYAREPFGEEVEIPCDIDIYYPIRIGTGARITGEGEVPSSWRWAYDTRRWVPIQNYNIQYITINDPVSAPIAAIPIVANRDYYLVIDTTAGTQCSYPRVERAPFLFVENWQANLKVTMDGRIRHTENQEADIVNGLNLVIGLDTSRTDPFIPYIPSTPGGELTPGG